MVDSEFISPLTNLGDQGDLRAALVRRVPYTFTLTDNPEDFVAVDAGTGSIPWALIWTGVIFYFDPADTTTAHDGITTLVTLDGYRYKTNGLSGEPRSVKSRTVTAPPTGPSIGDAYLVPTAASGAWAAYPNNVAIWTARGWEYVPPEVGRLVFVEDEDGFYHYGTAGQWDPGLGNSALGFGTVPASALMGGRTHWVVFNQTTNSPPASPAVGHAYIVGPAPTGIWAGQSGRIATWEANAWAFYVPFNGWLAFDYSLNTTFIYMNGWQPQTSGYDQVREAFTAAGVTPSVTGSNAYSYSNSVAPNTANSRFIDPQSLVVQASFPGQKFEIDYSCAFDVTGLAGTIAVFVDSETNARDWAYLTFTNATGSAGAAFAKLSLTMLDISSHTVRIARLGNNTLSGWGRRRLIARRVA